MNELDLINNWRKHWLVFTIFGTFVIQKITWADQAYILRKQKHTRLQLDHADSYYCIYSYSNATIRINAAREFW